MFARTRASPNSFLMLTDQIRDWRLALGPFTELPLTGTQSTAGGWSLGPVYYWILWLSRVTIGPWVSNFPHAGAIGISVLQSAADLLLLHALAKKTESLWLAVAATLLTATASHDLALSATIWNPAVSVAFVKATLALVLLTGDQVSPVRTAVITVTVWLAAQAHSSALFVAAPVLGSIVARDLWRRQAGRALQRARTMIEIVVVLQVPFLYHVLTTESAPGPNRLADAVAQTLSNPETLRLGASLSALLNLTSRILATPYYMSWLPFVLGVSIVVVLIRARRDLSLLSATVLPLACAAAGFAVWQLLYDEYWYLPLAPCAAVTVALAATTIRPKEASIALTVVVLALQPGRLAHSVTWYRMPEYRALARGARDIRRQVADVRRIDTSFPLPRLSSATFLYEVLGGRINPQAAFDATIGADGRATFTPVR
jgi:hypothetical protein